MSNKKKVTLFIAQLVILVVVLVLVVAYIASEKKEVMVYKFVRTIEYSDTANYAVKAEDIEATPVLAADMKDNYIMNEQEIIGKYITGTAYKEQFVVTNQLSSEPTYVNKKGLSDLAGYRKITLSINYATALAGDIAAGDRVDLMFTKEKTGIPSEKTEGYTEDPFETVDILSGKIFMQNIPVYQVYTNNGAKYTKKRIATSPLTADTFNGELSSGEDEAQEQDDGGNPAFITLTVTPEQYEEIVIRQMSGTVSIVGRFEESQDIDTNGYVMVSNKTDGIYIGQGTMEYDAGILDASEDVTKDNDDEFKLMTMNEFIRSLSMTDMNEAQKASYNSLYTEYTNVMSETYGDDWEVNGHKNVTAQQISQDIGDNEELRNRFDGLKTNLETLAGEIKVNALIPW